MAETTLSQQMVQRMMASEKRDTTLLKQTVQRADDAAFLRDMGIVPIEDDY